MGSSVDKALSVLMVLFIVIAVTMGILYALVAPDAELLSIDPAVNIFMANLGDELTTDYISCPVGTEVNIISADYFVYDPYSQCYPTGSLVFNAEFDVGSDPSTKPNKLCGPYWLGGPDLGDKTATTIENANRRTATGRTGENLNGEKVDPAITDCKYDGQSGITENDASDRFCWGGSHQCTVKNVTQYVQAACDSKGEKSNCVGVKVNQKLAPAPCNRMMSYTINDDFSDFPKEVAGKTAGGKQGYVLTGTYMCTKK